MSFNKYRSGRRGCFIMVSALVPGSSGLGSSCGWGNCVVYLYKTLDSHSASLSTQVCKWVLGNLMLGVTLRWACIPSRRVEILLVASFYKNQR